MELKFKTKIEKVNNNYKEEKKDLIKKELNSEKELKSKNILVLEDKLKRLLKLNLFEQAEEIKKNLEKERNIFNKEKELVKIKINEIKINNLERRKKKNMDKIMMNYHKEKNDLEILFNKEKNELFQKFKNQLNDFEMFKDKKTKNYKYNNSDYLFNQSFKHQKINKKLEDEEESLEDYP